MAQHGRGTPFRKEPQRPGRSREKTVLARDGREPVEAVGPERDVRGTTGADVRYDAPAP